VQEGRLGGRAPARGAHHEALLDQVGLDDVLDGTALLADRGGQALDADGSAVEALDDRREQAPVR